MVASEPAWPDKVVSAGMLLSVGGLLGVLFAGLRLAGATFGREIPSFLLAYPPWVTLVLSGAALLLGLLTIWFQAAVWGYLGAAAGIASMATGGITPIVSMTAVAFLVRAYYEGEELRQDHVRVPGEAWPDKAHAASLMLLVGGVITALQGVAILAGRFTPDVILADAPVVWGVFSIVAGILAGWGGLEVHRLRRRWAGWTASCLLVVALAFYGLGALFGVTALVLLFLASREFEFDPPTVRAAGARR